jgi:hypothetical protein
VTGSNMISMTYFCQRSAAAENQTTLDATKQSIVSKALVVLIRPGKHRLGNRRN